MKKITRVEKKKRRRRFFLRLILLLSLIFLIFVLALKTNFFLINDIIVTGNNKILYKTLVDQSNIEEKENIFKIDIRDSEKNIEKLSYVKEVKIKRKLPKTINIIIEEREEALQINSLSTYVILDKEGYILNIVYDKDNILPELIGFDVKNIALGDNLFLDLEGFNKDLIEEGQNLKLLSQIEQIELLENNDINILLFNGIDVEFGTIDNVKYKLNLLKEVLKDIENKELECKMIFMNRGKNPVIVLGDEEG